MIKTAKKIGRPRTAKFIENSAFASTAGTVASATGNPLADAKLAKIEAEVRAINLNTAIKLREYVAITEVTEEVSTEYTRVRQRILALESKLPHLLAPLTDPNEIKVIVNQEINEVLAELSADIKYENIKKAGEKPVKTTES